MSPSDGRTGLLVRGLAAALLLGSLGCTADVKLGGRSVDAGDPDAAACNAGDPNCTGGGDGTPGDCDPGDPNCPGGGDGTPGDCDPGDPNCTGGGDGTPDE